jgi:hypothetical protein
MTLIMSNNGCMMKACMMMVVAMMMHDHDEGEHDVHAY